MSGADSVWTGFVEKASLASLVCCMLAALSGGEPTYNIVIAVWGLYCSYNTHARAVAILLFSVLASLILDIVYCSIVGDGIAQLPSTINLTRLQKFSLAFVIINMFVKLGTALFSFKLFSDLGGSWTIKSSAHQDEYYGAAPGTGAQYQASGDTV